MDNFSTDLTPAEAPDASTQLDQSVAADPGQSQAKLPDEQKGPESRLEAIKRAAADIEKADPEAKEPKEEKTADPAPKPETDDKPEPEAKVDETGDEVDVAPKAKAETPRQDKARHPEPPQNFVPRAKELWVNVPNEVKGEVARVVQEGQQELARYREAIQPLARFDQMARQSGTTLPEALERYTTMENTLRANPTEGMRSLLMNMKMEPPQAIGHILRAFNVSPQALADHIAQQPEAYTPQQSARTQDQQPQQDPRVTQLEARLNEIEQERVVQSVWEPFLDENLRAAELLAPIVQILKSGMVPDSIRDPRQRLEVAHDMAVRLNPSAPVQANTSSDLEQAAHEAPQRRADPTFGGNKSIKGAPSAGVDISNRRRSKMSRQEAISAAAAELGLQ